jgi:sugar phosphate isomerase/epimerase
MQHEALDHDRTIDRRGFLRTAGAAALAAAAGPGALLAQDADAKKRATALWNQEPKPPYAPFRIAIQSYSMRKFDFEKAIETLFDLHVPFIEIWPDHMPLNLSDFDFKKFVKAMRHNMVAKIGYGVVDFGKDAEKNRAAFEFGRKLNLWAITADPEPESFPSLEKLVEEFKIKIAIHNHGPEDKHWGTPDRLEKALQGKHPSIGLCVDTGHYLLAGVDPIEVVRKFKDRVYEVHLKDVKTEGGKKKYSLLGQGDLDLVALLKELKKVGFRGGLAIEYEEDEDNPVPALEKCLKAVQEAVKKL